MKTAGNIFIIELKTSKCENHGKPSPTGTRRKDVFGAQAPWARTDKRMKQERQHRIRPGAETNS